MAPHEESLIKQLIEEVRALRSELQIIHTKLFGEKESENPQGRLPRLEALVEKQGKQIRRIEPVALWMRTLKALAIAGLGYLINHFLPFKGH